jgi:cobalamin biosynthesis protein CobD/CbiB
MMACSRQAVDRRWPREADAQDVARALRLYRRACALLIALVVVVGGGARWAH